MRYLYILALIFVQSAVKADQVMFSNGASIVAPKVIGDVPLLSRRPLYWVQELIFTPSRKTVSSVP